MSIDGTGDGPGGESGGESGGGGGGVLWVPSGSSVPASPPVFAQPAPPGWLQPRPYATKVILGSSFPPGAFDPLIKASVIAADFAADAKGWRTLLHERPYDNSGHQLTRELEVLWRFKERERSQRLAEINAQATDFTPYFAFANGVTASSRPATWSVILCGLQVGALVVNYYKLKHMRARPAQVWPALAPPIATPPHASFASGHSTQSHLIAFLLAEVSDAIKDVNLRLANRISENREVAGVHWPSDTHGGIALARGILPLLLAVESFRPILAAARTEWEGATIIAPPRGYPGRNKTPIPGG